MHKFGSLFQHHCCLGSWLCFCHQEEICCINYLFVAQLSQQVKLIESFPKKVDTFFLVCQIDCYRRFSGSIWQLCLSFECFFRSVTSMPRWKIKVNLCGQVKLAGSKFRLFRVSILAHFHSLIINLIIHPPVLIIFNPFWYQPNSNVMLHSHVVFFSALGWWQLVVTNWKMIRFSAFHSVQGSESSGRLLNAQNS